MARILVVDDEPNLAEAVSIFLRMRGHDVDHTGTGEDAVLRCSSRPYDLLVLDISLPGISGTDVFERVQHISPSTITVFITAHGTIRNAVDAIRKGGFDYITKPFDNDDLLSAVTRGLEKHRLHARITELEHDLNTRTSFVGIVGKSPAILEALRRLSKVAPSDATVLLAGETGTGKELAARSVHQQSPRAHCSFLAINCGAIPPTLAEAELFGHERGAFTDAKGLRQGWFEQAHRGTLFLDEVGDLSLDLQVKLLRVLEDRSIRRIGADRSTAVDVRVIVASHRALDQDVKTGRFREDLFWRLNVVKVEMPSLRDRREDIPLLVNHLLDRINAECRTHVTSVAPEALAVFHRYDWPGNVRELSNAIKHGAIMAAGPTIGTADLPDYLTDNSPASQSGTLTTPLMSGETLAQRLDQVMMATEQALVEAALERCRGNQSAAANVLGITRRTLYTKLRRYRPQPLT